MSKPVFEFDPKTNNVNISNVPYGFLDAVLTSASLQKFLSYDEYKMQRNLAAPGSYDCSSATENMAYVRKSHDELNEFAYGLKKACGQNPISPSPETNWDQWIKEALDSHAQRVKAWEDAGGKYEVPDVEPKASIAKARITTLSVVTRTGYLLSKIQGLAAENPYHSADEALRFATQLQHLSSELVTQVEEIKTQMDKQRKAKPVVTSPLEA